jgi:hypothetical protein
MQQLNDREEKFYKTFRSIKAFARKEELTRVGFSDVEQIELSNELVKKGYLSVNKLGHYKETAAAQKHRLGGKTAAQYVEEGRQRQFAENCRAFVEAFKPKTELEKELD